MALNTLTEGNKYSTTELDRVVIDRLVKDSPELGILPFEELLGNSLTYDTITTDANASFYSPGDVWAESTPVLTQATVTLKILGGDADIDNFVLATRSNKADLKGTVLMNKVKAVQHDFLNCFYYGDDSSNAKQFDGLQVLIADTTYNSVHAGTGGSGTGTALSIARLRLAVDLPRGSKPSHMMMTKAMRRGISVYLDSIGSAFPRGVNMYGNPCEMFDSIPIYTSDHILDTETASSDAYAASTGGANTTIFLLTFGGQDVCGCQAEGGVRTVPLGELETKDATRFRIKWYCGLKMENLRTSSKVDGIVAAGTVTA